MTTVTLELFRTSKNENTEPLKHKQMSTRVWGLVIVALVVPGLSTNLVIIIFLGGTYSYRTQIQNSLKLNVKFTSWIPRPSDRISRRFLKKDHHLLHHL